MSPEQIFNEYAKSIGIGGIAMAGIIGIVRSWGIIKSAVRLAASEMGGKKAEEKAGTYAERYFHENHRFRFYLHPVAGTAVLLLRCNARQRAAYRGSHSAGSRYLLPVYHRRSQCHCHCGNQPGIRNDADDLILASVIMVAVGLKGPQGMVASLVMGGVVCTALSMAGGFITDLKIGYWLGALREAGNLEIPRHTGFRSYRRRCDYGAE